MKLSCKLLHRCGCGTLADSYRLQLVQWCTAPGQQHGGACGCICILLGCMDPTQQHLIYLHTKSYLTLVCEYRILMTIMQTATIKLAMEQHTSSLSPLHYEVIIPLITLLVVKKMVQKTSQFTGKDYI